MIFQGNRPPQLSGNDGVSFIEEEDDRWMRYALMLAHAAEAADEVPVGAVIVYENQVVAEGFNQPIGCCDPSAHAEINAIRQAAVQFNNYRFPTGTRLYVTLEPCAMCAGAIIQARIDQVVFGAKDFKAGAAGSLFQILQDPRLNHRVVLVGGVLEGPCADVLRQFFKRRR